jgi:hypothetical protein
VVFGAQLLVRQVTLLQPIDHQYTILQLNLDPFVGVAQSGHCPSANLEVSRTSFDESASQMVVIVSDLSSI